MISDGAVERMRLSAEMRESGGEELKVILLSLPISSMSSKSRCLPELELWTLFPGNYRRRTCLRVPGKIDTVMHYQRSL